MPETVLPATVLAPAKLTVSLRVVGVRADGYHLLDAEMVTVDLADQLHLAEGDGLIIDQLAAFRDHEERVGPSVTSGEDNLVRRALALVGRQASVRLVKRIPAGAGLGGGSADAAAVLRWAGYDDLEAAADLGADVPFCIRGGRARVTGVGEVVEPLPFAPRTFTLLTPPLACPTAAVYRAWDDLGGPTGPGPNDLEAAALEVAPSLVQWRDALGGRTGCTPVLAGSGSTWFVEGEHPGPACVVVRTVPEGWTG